MNEFTTKVIAVIKKIPRGKVAAYSQVAALAGKPHAARGVAWILNTCSKKYALPWHRVVNSKARISFRTGSPQFRMQRRLLLAEKIAVEADGTILMKYVWKKKPSRPRNRPRMFG